MKVASYTLLSLSLVACRISQPLSLAQPSPAGLATPVAAAVSPVAPALSAAVRESLPRPPVRARPALALVRRAASQAPRRHSTRRLARHAPRLNARKLKRPVAWAASATAREPRVNPAFGFILAGVGAVIVLISLLAAPSVTSFGGAIILGATYGLGVGFIATGLLFGLFSYLLDWYERRQAARIDKPEK